ncbi:DEAD/DEAH box helicase [Chungangia koreensis]|uniref:DEAD/DEAH box helicase n=1 Tax=Chungangia koreensis TaxID=752657 RepID=A0ABV8X5S0_9LACT
MKMQLQVSIRRLPDGRFSLNGIHQGRLLPIEQLVHLLYFYDVDSLFGLELETHEDGLVIDGSELLSMMDPMNRQPFIELIGADDSAEELLETAEEISRNWNDIGIWQAVTVQEGRLMIDSKRIAELFIGETNAPLTEQLLHNAIANKLQTLGVHPDQLSSMLGYLRTYGWPSRNESNESNLHVALRLSEPDEEVDEWMLETVLIGKNGVAHWTPSSRKKNAPIQLAVPPKWEEYVPFIEEKQEKMLRLIQLDAVPDHLESFLSIPLTDADVRSFLKNDLSALQALRFDVILPGWLKEVTETKMKVRSSASTGSFKSAAGMNEILQFNWSFSLNGQDISKDDFQRLVDEKREFIRAGNEWFRIDAEWLQRIRELMDRAETEEWKVKDLVFHELPEEINLQLDDDDEEEIDPLFQFELQQSLAQYAKQIHSKKGLPKVPPSPYLLAELRPYQVEGLEWLVFMREAGFGAVLADDMGLGKTVQLISYLLHVHRSNHADRPSLIICPTSVLGNWQKELDRFAPELKVFVHYGQSRAKGEKLDEVIRSSAPDIVMTTYGTASQDVSELTEQHWASITLDEAQNIKNMHTKQSKAIRKLHGEHHIALTGTPVENRLSELWAIFDFVHHGYLGSYNKFVENFIGPIERDDSENHKRKLRNKIGPFLLRRSKTDPELLLNLPEKMEQLEFCPLTTEQAALYESFLADSKMKLETLTGFEKKGLILKMLSKLKQLCNHPALYLKEPFQPAAEMMERSEKLNRLITLAADIASSGEQCLIFTQYIGMGQLIQHCLAELYDIDVPFLTGRMPKHQRDQLVEAFQQHEFPIFILSLKAGGTGLNLTAANHVLHADRWWNPAVENQATDRAYRIGQTRFVHVHKFVTIGTIEEKIDKLLTEKQLLSDELIQSSKWLTELSDEELEDLLRFDA